MTEKFYGHEWFAEFFVRDMEEMADRLRRSADFIDAKAALLRRQMLAAQGIEAAIADETATEIGGSVHESPVAGGDAPNPTP